MLYLIDTLSNPAQHTLIVFCRLPLDHLVHLPDQFSASQKSKHVVKGIVQISPGYFRKQLPKPLPIDRAFSPQELLLLKKKTLLN